MFLHETDVNAIDLNAGIPNATHEILSNETKDNKSNNRGNLDPMQQNEKEKDYCTERFQKKMKNENRKKERNKNENIHS